MKKLYAKQLNNNNKFSYASILSYDLPDEDGFIEVTQEMLDGLDNYTLCWENGEIVPNPNAEEDKKNAISISFPTQKPEIMFLKLKLSETDYQAIKFAEGELTAEEYEPVKQQRRAWRERINELEKLL